MKKQKQIIKVISNIIVITFILFFTIGCSAQTSELKNEESISTEEPTITENSTSSASNFAVHFIDVGKGDSILITCDGKSMLIDGGKAENGSKVTEYLKNLNITHLDYIIGTHPHDDHIGGLPYIINHISVSRLFSPISSYESTVFEELITSLNEQNINITIPEAGQEITLGSSVVKFLGPLKNYSNENNNSIVVRIVYGNTSFLFMGDAGKEAEKDIIDAGYDLKADVLKVGHHGSSAGTSEEFLNVVEPHYAVISVGDNYQYSLLSKDTLSRLENSGTTIYRTDLNGNAICTSDGNTISFIAEKN